jgi:ADP-dependent NAD(P)H-hydrate dehydratase
VSAVVTPALLRDWSLPAPGAGKSARGQVLVLGGTTTTPGGVLLAGEASLRSGAGKLLLAVPAPLAVALGVAVPEAGVTGLSCDDGGSLDAGCASAALELASDADAVLVGSGFMDPDSSTRLLEAFTPDLEAALVLDALGSAFLTDHPEGLHHLGGRAVLTVNPTELQYVAHCEAEDVENDAEAVAAEVARRSRVVVLCGGSEKTIVTPDGDAWVVQGGGPGLGVSGSGDVQAGVVAGLLARGAEPAQAAVWAAYLHARAGERLAASVGAVGYLAREIPPELPAVLAELG